MLYPVNYGSSIHRKAWLPAAATATDGDPKRYKPASPMAVRGILSLGVLAIGAVDALDNGRAMTSVWRRRSGHGLCAADTA